MDADGFRSILKSCDVDVWTFIDAAIDVASLDYGSELKKRREGIIDKLFAKPSSSCRKRAFDNKNDKNDSNIIIGGHGIKGGFEKDSKGGGSPSTPRSVDDDEAENEKLDIVGGFFGDEQKRIVDIRLQIEDPRQTEDSLVDLLQSLADMDITFQALKETDIGRHVNQLRKHSSGDVRRLVKQLVRNWKKILDEWAQLNLPDYYASSALMAPQYDDQASIQERSPVPRLVACDQHGCQYDEE